MKRRVFVELQNGEVKYAEPYHICLKGVESAILFRCEDDYDAMVKRICICAKKKNVILVTYAVVSNHCHMAVLAGCHEEATGFGNELKRLTGKWFSAKYGEKNILRGVTMSAILLEDNKHVRNAIAYICRNALDNGGNILDYEWSGFNAAFRIKDTVNLRHVSGLSKREKEAIIHSKENLSTVSWLLDDNLRLVPWSICAGWYIEQAFENDQAYYLRTVGAVDTAEMTISLVRNPRIKVNDSEFFKVVSEITLKWYETDVGHLTKQKKARLIRYLDRTRKTTVSQLARTTGLTKDEVSDILRM